VCKYTTSYTANKHGVVKPCISTSPEQLITTKLMRTFLLLGQANMVVSYNCERGDMNAVELLPFGISLTLLLFLGRTGLSLQYVGSQKKDGIEMDAVGEFESAVGC